MSSPGIVQKEPKSLTAGFQLETKIRLIIQEVLAATMRKLSHFGDKIEKFQEYFITFKERFETAERERGRQQQQMQKIEEAQINIKRDLNFNEIRYNEDRERQGISVKESRDQIGEIEKQVKTLLRQNQNINSELSKTKSKFLEYSNIISTLKQEVSWKITKYLEETAQSHTQMKVYSENIRNQYFNINLLVEKQKVKYDEIIIKYEEDTAFKQDIISKNLELLNQIKQRGEELHRLNSKVDDLEFSLLSKLKIADTKIEAKMVEFEKSNSKLGGVFKKVDSFSALLGSLRQEAEESQRTIEKRLQQVIKRAHDISVQEGHKAMKEGVKIEKALQKKISALDAKIQKQDDFLTQKIDFMKMEIESEMSGKTAKLLQQKSKAEQNLSSSTLEQINGKIARFQLQQNKNISRIQTFSKQGIADLRTTVEQIKFELGDKLERVATSRPKYQGGGPVSINNQTLQQISNQIGKLQKGLTEAQRSIQNLQAADRQAEKELQQLRKWVQNGFVQFQEKVAGKVEKVMFLVTKMRGDSIIRNQFSDKEVRQLKKQLGQARQRLDASWKLLPSLGECVNLVLSLIYDAQFQHSRIIQDNLPLLGKDVEKFNTCCEGVIYEFREKKKPGSIFYRHSQIRKTDIVRATFSAYIQVWEQIFEGELKSKPAFLPKTFYKRLVEKHLKQPSTNNHLPNPNSTQSINQLLAPKPNLITENSRHGSQTSIDGNNSFHIRKKRTVPPTREKEREDFSLAQDLFERIQE